MRISDWSSDVCSSDLLALLKTGALQNAILTSANFSIIATDELGIIQLFNVGAERMLGYLAAEVVNQLKPSDLHDPQEVIARAQALSLELRTPIAAGRTEERRVGKEWVRTLRSRWSPSQ